MDLMKFQNPNEPTLLNSATFLKKPKSLTWIERYRDPGEFTILAGLDSGLKEELPRGTFITHMGTPEVMVVEDHNIVVKKGEAPTIKITGRSLETILENRPIVSNNPWAPLDFVALADYSWNQAVGLIAAHITYASGEYADNVLPYFRVSTDITATSASEIRWIQRGDLHTRLIELLQVDDLGIRILRPSVTGINTNPFLTIFLIHLGEDKTDQIVFSHNAGELTDSEYLWSIRKLKNSALVTGKWVKVFIPGTETGYDRRIMHVDASDLDDAYSSMPTGGTLTDIEEAMLVRGQDALAANNEIALASVNISKTANKHKYRIDYNVGDIVTVIGDFNEARYMRISEYVEIEDENGFVGYPTLSTS